MLGIRTQIAVMRSNLDLESHKMVRKAILIAYIVPIVLSIEAIVLNLIAEWTIPYPYLLSLALYAIMLWVYLQGRLGTSMLFYVVLWLLWCLNVLNPTVHKVVINAGVGFDGSKHGLQLNLLAIVGALPFGYAFFRLWKSSRDSVVDEYI